MIWEKKVGVGKWTSMHTTWPWKQKQQQQLQLDSSDYKKMRPAKVLSGKSIFVLCIVSFLAGSLFTSHQKDNRHLLPLNNANHFSNLHQITSDSDHKRVSC